MVNEVALKDAVSYIRGITFKPSDLVTNGTKHSVVCMRTKNIQLSLDETDLISVPESFVKREEQKLRYGDILISSANSWNLVGKCVFVHELPYNATAGGFISIVRSKKEKLYDRYLYHWLASSKTQHYIRYCGRQTTNISNLSKDRFLDLKIPLPSIGEQKRIAAILDKADAIRRKREKAIELADEFLKSVFLDMFGDIPAKKSRYTFKHIRPYVKARSGKSSKNVISAKKTEIPIWGGNGVNGWALEPLYHEPVIVVGRVGQRCGITYLTEGPSWVTDNAIVIEIEDLNLLHPTYLEAAFRNSPIREQVKHLDLPFVNQSMLLDSPIPIPPLSEQKKYALIKKKVLCMQKMQRRYASKTNRLFSALSQQAFRGDL